LACNLLAVPTLDRLLTNLVPADLLFCLGVRASADYAPFLEQHHYKHPQPDTVEVNSYHFDHLSWSYRVFAGFLLDRSVGLMTEGGASWPVAGEIRVSRTFLRFGFIFRL